MNRTFCRTALSLCAAVAATSPALGQLTLDPGTILTGDYDTNTLIKYDQSGNILQTLPLIDNDGIGTFDGATVFNNGLYVCGTGSRYAQVDLNTGMTFGGVSGVTVSGTECLGNSPTEVLMGGYSSNTVDRFDGAGNYLGTISLNTNVGMTGLDSDGTSLFIGSYGDGNIYMYDMAGNQTGMISTGIGGGSVSGLGYDPGNSTVWISLGFGDDTIRQYDLNGNNLTTFNSQYGSVNGLDIIPIPAPGAGVLAMAGALLATRRRR